MEKIIASPYFRKAAWIGAALLLAYTLAGFVIAPSWLARAVPDYAERYLGRRASVGDIRINPYLFSLEVSGLQLDDAPGQPLLKLGRLHVDFELSSIFGRAWTFADVALEGLELSLVIDRERRLNIMEVIERFKKLQEQEIREPSPPPGVVLERVSLSDGSVRFSDFSEEAPGDEKAAAATITLSPINLTLAGVSTIPDQKGRYLLEAQIPGGGTLAWKGDATLIPLTSNGEASLRELKLASIWQFFRGKVQMAQPRGALSLSTNYGFSYGEGKAALALTSMELDLSDLSIALPGKAGNAPLLELHSMQVKDAQVLLDQREIAIPVLRLSGIRASANRQGDGKLDWQNLLPPSQDIRNGEEKAVPRNETPPWRVHIGDVVIEKTALAYADHTLSPPLAFRVGNLDSHFGLDIAGEAGKTGKTRVGAKALKLSVEDVVLAPAPVSDDAAPFAAIGGLRLDGGNPGTAARTVTLPGKAGNAPLLELRSMQVNDAHVSLDEREIAIPVLRLSGIRASASRQGDGKLDWQNLLPPSQDIGNGEEKAAPGSETAPWRVHIGDMGIEKTALAYTDHALSPPLAFRVGNLDSHFGLDIAGEAGKTGKTRVGARALKLSAENVVLAPIFDDAAPLAAIGGLHLDGGNLDTAARTVALESAVMNGGGLALTQGADGPEGLLRLLMNPVKASPSRSKESEESKAGLQSQHADAAASEALAEPPWKYRVGTLELKQFKMQLAERTYTPAVAYGIDAVSIALEGIDSTAGTPARFKAELGVNGRGTIKASGTVGQDFKQAKIALDAAGIPLVPLRPVVTRYISADLASGLMAASTELNYRSGASPEMTVTGSAGIQDFRMNETETGDRLISWKALLAQKINLSMAPNQLLIKEIHLHEPGLKLAIDKQRNVNLNQVLKDRSTGKDAVESRPPSSGPGEKDGKNVPFRARIALVRVEQGTLDFSDMSLVLPFSTRVQELEGSIAGISSSPRSRTELRLNGQVEDYGKASAAGRLLTSDPKKFLDIEANFGNIRMQPLSPYSATFAGRKIDAGKLWLTLHYKIVNGSLLGENRVELADFRLGEQVEAPGALDLPLDLAVALLKGPNDRINLAVEVRGDVGSPTFDYGKVVRAAVANAIRRVVTAPFRALKDLGGGEDAEQLRKVEFEPGSDDIEPSQRELLDELAQAMKQRPGVGVIVRGPYDPERDGESLRRQQVHRDLLIATGGVVEERGDPGLIGYGDAETQKALEQLLRERSGDGEAVSKFAETYKQRTGQEPQRVNPVLGLFGRGSRDREFYRAMFDRLVELQPLEKKELEELAASRARAVSDALRKAGIDSQRITVRDIQVVTGKARAGEEGSDTVAGELALSAVPAEN